MKLTPVVLAALSACSVAVGVAFVYFPAGLIVAGLEGLAAAYVVAYLAAGR